ncbi:Eaf6p, partial [Ascoidea rubescens DSM 1968]
YEKCRKELHESILKKRTIDKKLTDLEDDIFDKETIYLSDNLSGNLIKGFENFTRTTHHHSNSTRFKKNQFTDDDRIFSLSSAVYIK